MGRLLTWLARVCLSVWWWVQDHPSGSHEVGFITEMAKAGRTEVKALLAQVGSRGPASRQSGQED